MSSSPEAFLSLRSHFVRSHALLCLSHWLLGIGDRHLSNFMVNTESGGIIGIDFGHAFGSATQVGHTCSEPGPGPPRDPDLSAPPSSSPCPSSCPSG